MIVGDFNLPEIVWEDGRLDAKGRGFFQACNGAFLEQRVKEATHINGNRLDLVLTDRSDRVIEVKTDRRIDRSDHEIVVNKLARSNKSQNRGQQYRNFNRGKYDGARTKIARIDWEGELEGKNVEGTWNMIKGILMKVIEEYVPWRKQEKTRPMW